jgi:hypothetical protein
LKQFATSVTPRTLVDFNAIAITSSGSYNGASLFNGPEASGSNGVGVWKYDGNATAGTLWLQVIYAPDNRSIEGFWTRTKTAGNWGSWAIALKPTDYAPTTGSRTVFTGEYVLVGDGHTMSMTYLDSKKTIRLKPATDWANVPQPLTLTGGTVPTKPASGNAAVEYKINTGTLNWEIVPPTPDPVDTRLKAVEPLVAQSILVTMTPPAGVGTNMLCNYDNGVMSVASCSGANAKPANCFVANHSGATTNFYRADFTTTWVPTGSIKGRMLFLGVDGAFSLNEPANTQGNIIQKVSMVLADGTGLIDIKEPIFVGA